MYRAFINLFKKPILGISALLLLGVLIYVILTFYKKTPEKKTFVHPIKNNMPHPETLSSRNAQIGFEQGKQYLRLDDNIVKHNSVQQLISETPGKVQVIEFFNYACFGCAHLHPIINDWLKIKPNTVAFYRFPVVFNQKWVPLAKAYFVTNELNETTKLDPELFAAIHQKHIDLSNEKLLAQFFVEHGIPEKQFFDLYHSFTTDSSLKKAVDIANAYRISLSPVIIVNGPSGSYLLSGSMAGDEKRFIEILNYLVSRESRKLEG